MKIVRSTADSQQSKSNVIQQVVGIRSSVEKTNFRILLEGSLQEPYRGVIGPLQTICLTVPSPHLCYYILQVCDSYGGISHYLQSGLGATEIGQTAKILIENQTDKQRDFLVAWI